MESEFWLDMWERRQTGFHQPTVNGQLQRFWPGLEVERGGAVFVPLCGKSGDMRWLRDQGHPVLGVELSPLAADAFFSENGLVPERSRQGGFDVYEAGGIRILCGNFFDLTAKELTGVEAAYDRAALIALPPEMQERYAARMAEILPAGTPMLLLTLEYPREEMKGPPFSVPRERVEELYGSRADVRELARDDLLPQEPHFAERGVTSLHADAFRVTLGA